MRFVILVIAIFLWGIWFEVARIDYAGEFFGSASQNFIGWGGFILLAMSGGMLLRDWSKKSDLVSWIKKRLF